MAAFWSAFNMILWTIMKFTRAKPYASVVLIFLFNFEYLLINNLAVRNLLTFLAVDMGQQRTYEIGILLPFILINCYQTHDIKWFLFLNGPIFLIGSYLHAFNQKDETLKLDPNLNTEGMIRGKMVTAIAAYVVISFSHYMT